MNLNKALEIVSRLIAGEEIRNTGANLKLYEEYNSNMEVYDIIQAVLKNLNLKIYEYNYGLYVCAGENNRVFGYTNEELRRAFGVRVNKELYLCYYIIYHIVSTFISDADTALNEYVKCEDIIKKVDATIPLIIDRQFGVVITDMEADSLKAVALLWDELPASADEEGSGKASKASKIGFVKLTFNFLISQGMFILNEGKYYALDRFYAIAKNYYEENRGRLSEIMKGN